MAENLVVEEAQLCLRSWGQWTGLGGGRWWTQAEGTLGRDRYMLDSHRLAPYPELTFQFFGEVVGQGREGR